MDKPPTIPHNLDSIQESALPWMQALPKLSNGSKVGPKLGLSGVHTKRSTRTSMGDAIEQIMEGFERVIIDFISVL